MRTKQKLLSGDSFSSPLLVGLREEEEEGRKEDYFQKLWK